MLPSHTHIVAVLDESGSMQHLRQSTIDGFNRFVEEQKTAPGTADLTLVIFNVGWRMPLKAMDIKHVVSLEEIGYRPDNGTGLLDALGNAIKTTGDILAPDADVVFLVITDGQENASTDFKLAQVKEMIVAREAQGWKFIYLGANQDAFSASADLGMASTLTANYAASASGTQSSYGYSTETVTAMRSAKLMGKKLSDEELVQLKNSWSKKMEDKETKDGGTP